VKRPWNHKTLLKMGDPRPNTTEYVQDGKFFYCYNRCNGFLREQWVTAERLEEIRDYARKKQAQYKKLRKANK